MTVSAVPEQAKLQVFQYLPAQSVVALGGTCRELHQISKDDVIWKPLCEAQFADIQAYEISPPNGNFIDLYKLYKSTLDPKSPMTSREYKRELHSESNLSYMRLMGKFLCTQASSNNDFKIRDVTTDQMAPKEWTGTHPNLVRSKVAGGLLYTFSNDMLKVWDIETGEELRTYNSSSATFPSCLNDIQVVGRYFYCIDGNQAKAIDAVSGECIQTIQCLTPFIKNLRVHGHFLFADTFEGTSQGVSEGWNIQTGQCFGVFKAPDPSISISKLTADDRRLYAKSGTNYYVWNIPLKNANSESAEVMSIRPGAVRTNEAIKKIKVSKMQVYSISDQSIKIWDKKTNKYFGRIALELPQQQPLPLSDMGECVESAPWCAPSHVRTIGKFLFVTLRKYGAIGIWDTTTKEHFYTINGVLSRDGSANKVCSEVFGSHLFVRSNKGQLMTVDLSANTAPSEKL